MKARAAQETHGWRIAVEAATRDLFVDWRASLCVILGLAAVLAPLLVLFGLKFGVVEVLRDRLLQDPRVLEVTPLGNHTLERSWYADLRARTDVAFVVPRTRSLAATIFVQPGEADVISAAELAELVPTGQEDPLLAGGAQPGDLSEVVVSRPLADTLAVAAEDTVRAFVTRTLDGQRQRADIQLTIARVLPASAFTRPALFVPVPIMSAVEDYRDGYAVPMFDWPGEARETPREAFASARIYASDLERLPALVDHLEDDLGIPVRSRAADVAGILSLNRSLSLGFWIVAGLGTAGFFLSLSATLWTAIERKRIALGTLSLLGVRRRALVLFPITQAVLIGLAGILCAIVLYGVADAVVERVFAETVRADGGSISRLLPRHFSIAAISTLAFCVLAAGSATLRIARIDPSETMRER